MSDNVCPKCGCHNPAHFLHCPDHPGVVNTLQSEIARMKSELEKAERARYGWSTSNSKNIAAYNDLVDLYVIATEERDEARRWARHFYQAHMFAKRYFDNLFDESNKGTNDNA